MPSISKWIVALAAVLVIGGGLMAIVDKPGVLTTGSITPGPELGEEQHGTQSDLVLFEAPPTKTNDDAQIVEPSAVSQVQPDEQAEAHVQLQVGPDEQAQIEPSNEDDVPAPLAMNEIAVAEAERRSAELAANLETCKQNAVVLAERIVALQQNDSAVVKSCDGLDAEIIACREDFVAQRRTNTLINKELMECRTQLDSNFMSKEVVAESEGKIAELTEALAIAKRQVAELTARLKSFGYTAEPTFRYATEQAYDSFVSPEALARVLGASPRLSANSCADGLAWLEKQKDPNRPIRKVLWVWQGEDVLLCQRAAEDGPAATSAPSSNDQAHAVIFQ